MYNMPTNVEVCMYPFTAAVGCSALFLPAFLWPESVGEGDVEKDLDL